MIHRRSMAPPTRAALGMLLYAALAAALAGNAAAQDDFPDLHTDRDAFTPATACVEKGEVLAEGSYVYIDNVTGLPTNNYPEWIWRIGTADWFEWRLGVNYSVGTQGNIVTSVEVGETPINGGTLYESNILYGFKAAVSEQHGPLPESCFLMEAVTPTKSELLGTVPVATYVAGWELPVRLPTRGARPCRIDSAIRYSYAESRLHWFSRWAPSVVLRMPVTERWEVHAEYFGTFPQGLPITVNRPFFSPGTHYMLTKNLEIGLRVGWGLTDIAAPFFSDAGIGWRW